uniref:Acetyl-coenzyme A carboxylase carboxyl transferase subunit beta, chloroplastic n=1 Tax=Pterocladiophila hemisphaerica TaxID=2712948 RepID=A0A6M3WWE4_9FLOR|nr:AccD [Pterocladiophila hemisphaerica]
MNSVNFTTKNHYLQWLKCKKCQEILYHKQLNNNFYICLKCGYYFKVNSHQRIKQLLDLNSWKPLNQYLTSNDPLGFTDKQSYKNRLHRNYKKTLLYDAVETGSGTIYGKKIAIGIMNFNFMGGSMGSVVGEKITRLIEQATIQNEALLLISASGGARMQEGILSLMQMAKISAALLKYKQKQLLYLSLLTSPTTGGVTASFAMLGDLILAEPKALIAFAGRRVIEQTIQEKLPQNFQTTEYLSQHGFIDLIINRKTLKEQIYHLLYLHRQN